MYLLYDFKVYIMLDTYICIQEFSFAPIARGLTFHGSSGQSAASLAPLCPANLASWNPILCPAEDAARRLRQTPSFRAHAQQQ